MAINLAVGYADEIASAFSRDSFIKGKTATTFDLTGVKTLKVYTPVTVDEIDYVRDGTSRYGAPVEMQDTVQELTMTQDKAFTLTIDKGNNLEQKLVKRAADMLRLQLKEKSAPAADKYALSRFAHMAGKIAESDKPTKGNIISLIGEGMQALDDGLVPPDGRYLYISSEMHKLICLSDEFVGIDPLGAKSVAKGICGEVLGMEVVRVPESYMPENCWFLITHKDAVLMPYKIADAKVHEDPVGVSGALIEGRHYYDAFVLGAKCAGVYACVKTGMVTAKPVNNSGTLTCTDSGAVIRYTVDGSDPRYSDSAREYSTKIITQSGEIIRAYAEKAGKYASAVV